MIRPAPPEPSARTRQFEPWIAWDRDLSRVVASGPTFEAAKRAAAALGKSSVMLTRQTSSGPPSAGRLNKYMVAVFVAK